MEVWGEEDIEDLEEKRPVRTIATQGYQGPHNTGYRQTEECSRYDRRPGGGRGEEGWGREVPWFIFNKLGDPVTR